MNICIFIDSPLDAPGGTVQSVLNQRTVLRQAGHEVYIVCLGTRIIDDSQLYYARPYLSFLTDDVNFAYLLSNPITTRLVERFLRRHRIDLVHVQSESTTAHMGVVLARRLGLPVIATVHNYFWPATGPLQFTGGLMIEAQARVFAHQKLVLSQYGNNRLERAIRGLTEQICRQVDLVITPSAHLCDTLRTAGIDTPIEVVPNPYVEHASSPSPQLLSQQPAHFVWVGRCAPEKRLMEFMQAVQLATASATQPFSVTIIGDGPDLAAARQFAAAHELSDIITFTGRVSNDTVVASLDAASLVVLSSYHFDNQPVVVSEAVSRYRGVLYCDERLQEGVRQAGLRSPTPDARSLAETMVTVIDDPSIAIRLSRQARRAAGEFAGATYARKLAQIARTLAAQAVV